MSDYISREAVERFIENGLNNPDKSKAFGHDAVEILTEVHFMDAADVRPVKEGYWIENCTDYICSACGGVVSDEIVYMLQSEELPYYCPHCGVKLKGVQP